MANFIRRLQVLFSASIPLSQCLDALAKQEENPLLVEVIERVNDRIRGGRSLSEAMRLEQGLFSRRTVSMLKLGESSGQLDSFLQEIATAMEQEADLLQRVKSALTYPVILASGSILVVATMFLFFVPQLMEFTKSMHTDLDPILRSLFALTEVLTDPVIVLAAVQVFFAMLFLAYRALKTEVWRSRRDGLLLSLPLIGPVLLELSLVRFGQSLRSLLICGCPLVPSLNLLGEVMANDILKAELKLAKEGIIGGKTLATALADYTRFDNAFISIISVGEEAGTLETSLDSIVVLKMEQLHTKLDTAVSLIEPLVLCFVGGMVGLVTLMFFVPMSKLVQSL